MKKFFFVLLVCMLLSNVTFASKSKFKDPQYPFNQITAVNLKNAVYEPYTTGDDFKEDNDPVNRTLNALRTAFAKSKIQLDEESKNGNVDLTMSVHQLGTFTYWSGPWVEEVFDYQPVYRHHYHHRHNDIIYIPIRRTVVHPGRWITDAYAEVEFTVKDAKTGRMIYNVRDERQRQDTSYDGMLKRICNDFVKDIKK